MEYLSVFAHHISDFIAQKQALGYKYQCEQAILRRFDSFCRERYPEETVLNREIMLDWASSRPHEHPATLQGRVTPVQEFAKYMARLELPSFILPPKMLPQIPRYLPYIYSGEELKKIFEQTDKCHYQAEVPYRHYVMPVFFRLLYGCGLRLSEARLLKMSDVDLDGGIITIKNAKLDKHRQIPVSPQMLDRMRIYYQNVHLLSKPDDWFFPGGYRGSVMNTSSLEKNFRRFLWNARISHSGRSKIPGQTGGPRIHDLRHTFSVNCLRNWVLEGKDLRAYMPVLQAYLGHVSYADTAYYLHLTADLFPNIVEKAQYALGDIIPKAGDYVEAY